MDSKQDLYELIRQHPERVIRAYAELLSAAFYYQEISGWTDDEYKMIMPELRDHYAGVVLKAKRLSEILSKEPATDDPCQSSHNQHLL